MRSRLNGDISDCLRVLDVQTHQPRRSDWHGSYTLAQGLSARLRQLTRKPSQAESTGKVAGWGEERARLTASGVYISGKVEREAEDNQSYCRHTIKGRTKALVGRRKVPVCFGVLLPVARAHSPAVALAD